MGPPSNPSLASSHFAGISLNFSGGGCEGLLSSSWISDQTKALVHKELRPQAV